MKYTLLVVFILVFGCKLWLRHLNLAYLAKHGDQVPHDFEGLIDQGLLRKTTQYTLANSRLGLIETFFDTPILLLFIFGGVLPWYDQWVGQLTHSFLGQGLIFVLGLSLVQTILGIPFSLYRTFVLEERFQFNTSTPKIWITDLMKSLLIGGLLLSLVSVGALALVQSSPEHWWLWVWGFLALMTLLLMYLSPVLIEPWFFKFEPLQNEALAERVKTVMTQAGLKVDRVQQVDASRRSKHSNAYFTGIGRVKRIVLFDTLLDQMNDDEILAVLAHEAGHWKLGHIWKRLLSTKLVSLGVCWLAWVLLDFGQLPAWFGLGSLSFVGQVVLLGFLLSLVGFPLTPLSSWLSRRHEWQADRFAMDLTGDGKALSTALAKLSRENLSNLHPHPVFAWFYYSHPPVTARIAKLTAPRKSS